MSVLHRILATAGVLVALVSCSTATDGSANPSATTGAGPSSSAAPETASSVPSLPPRSRTYDVSSVNPCSLLTTEQQATFGINRPVLGPNVDDPLPGSTLCTYINSAAPGGTEGYGVSTDVARNAGSLIDSALDTSVDTVGGIGAVVVDARGGGCTYVLDTSDTTNIQVGITTSTADPAVNCPKAKAAAEAVMTTLTALQPG